MDPAAIFRYCQTDATVYSICKSNRAHIWHKYFEQDILPYLYDPKKHLPTFPNYNDDMEFLSDWKTMSERLHQQPDSVSNAEIYTLYQKGIQTLYLTAWLLAEKFRHSFNRILVDQEILIASLGLTNDLDFPAIQRDLIEFTTSRIQNICRLKKRLRIESTSTTPNQNKLLTIKPGPVARFLEYAIASGNDILMREIVLAWPTWFYMIYDDGKRKVDFLQLIIKTIAETIDRNEVSGEQGKALTREFVRLFVIPNAMNLRGRFSSTYSDKVKEMLQPIKSSNDAFQDRWHQAVESIWMDELDAKF